MEGETATSTDVMETPEQVLAAGGVSKRRRGVSSSKRRSPSGHRRRAATPEPPQNLQSDPDEETEVNAHASASNTASVRRISTAKKALIMKRSHSSPGEGRQTLSPGEMKQEEIASKPAEALGQEPDLSPAKPAVTKRKSTAEKILVTKRSHSSPGEGRLSLSSTAGGEREEQGAVAPPRRRTFSSDGVAVGESADEPAVRKLQEGMPGAKHDDAGVVKVQTPSPTEAATWKEAVCAKPAREATWGPFFRDARQEWKRFVTEHSDQWNKIIGQRNRCLGALVVMCIYCGLGGLVFRFTEGTFEAFYKCGVKRVKRDFVDSLWLGSHHLLEDDWKSQARRKLMELETQLHAAHDAGVTTYSGQRSWSFLNAVLYCLTVVTTIGYGHISPSTTTGRAITILYAIFGIPMFLILLADFGKLFTRGIKFLWAFVRRLYYTGSCKKVRRTVPVQEVMKGVQLVYDFATFRRPSQMVGESGVAAPIARPEDVELQVPLNPQPQPNIPLDSNEPPGTPAISTFEVDDEFNLPISVAIVILLIYIFVGAFIYWTWENWGFFESFYFVFISMSTIGFGDFVPQHPMYMMASIVYLIFGLALTSMCINVVQEKLSDSFRQASAKIGATIGLRVNEEDGSITPVPPPQIEIPEVHGTVTKSQST